MTEYCGNLTLLFFCAFILFHSIPQMCSGIFIDVSKLDVGPDALPTKDVTQVALGCASGAIHILHNFTVSTNGNHLLKTHTNLRLIRSMGSKV